MSETRSSGAPTPARRYLWVAALAAIVGFGAVYVTLGRPDNSKARLAVASAPGEAKPPAGATTNPLSAGAMAGFVFKKAPEPLPDVTFTDKTGKEMHLADWKGRVVLLNLWATWCGPCREEMPSLDRLQKALGSDKFHVIALANDRTGTAAVLKFLDGIKVASLTPYIDSTTRSGSALKVIGMPTTLLIDTDGREIGRFMGPAEWDGPDARKLIEAQLK